MDNSRRIPHPTEADARRNLQTYLRQLSYTDPSIPAVPIDGISGERTTNAIRAFQKNYGLPETGVADQQTWDEIYGAFLTSVRINARPKPFFLFPSNPVNYAISDGDEGFLVRTVQYLLQELAVLFPSFNDVNDTGVYDRATQRAIREFQARTLNDQTGNTNRETWNSLVSLYDTLALYIEP